MGDRDAESKTCMSSIFVNLVRGVSELRDRGELGSSFSCSSLNRFLQMEEEEGGKDDEVSSFCCCCCGHGRDCNLLIKSSIAAVPSMPLFRSLSSSSLTISALTASVSPNPETLCTYSTVSLGGVKMSGVLL